MKLSTERYQKIKEFTSTRKEKNTVRKYKKRKKISVRNRHKNEGQSSFRKRRLGRHQKETQKSTQLLSFH